MPLFDRSYKPGAPTQQAADIDSLVCANSKCRKCHHKGMRYEPWNRQDSYVAIAVCPSCGYREEF